MKPTFKEIKAEKIDCLKKIKEHHKPLWPKVQRKLNSLKTPEDKLAYIEQVRLDYDESVRQNVEVFYSSGTYIHHTYPHEIGMDGMLTNAEKRIRLEHGLKEQKGEKPKFNSFKELFTEDFTTHLDKLTTCTPALLKKKGSTYTFSGHNYNHRGVIGAYFKALKSRGIVNSKANKFDIANVLNKELKNYHIDPSSVNNASSTYTKVFEQQLLKTIS